MYDETIERINKKAEPDNVYAVKILQWISLAKRPLLVKDLQHALAVKWDKGEDQSQGLDFDNF